MKTSFYQYNYSELETLLGSRGLSTSGASLLFNWHYKQKHIEPCTKNLAQTTQLFLKESMDFTLSAIVASEYHLDAELANLMVGISIPLSFITVPLWNYFLFH